MKLYNNGVRFSLLIILAGLIISSCKKDHDSNNNNTNTLPAPISNIVPQTMVDSLRAAGAVVNEGTTPPIVNGIYLMTPDSCTYDNSPGNLGGTLFSDYKFRFTNQDNASFTISVEQKAEPSGTLSSTPVETYISGNGNNFSIFLLRTVSPQGITVQQFNVLSGTLTSNGIQNLQNTLYMRSKVDDPTNVVVPAGTIRVFINGAPGLAATQTSF